jgi:hypothetical protein
MLHRAGICAPAAVRRPTRHRRTPAQPPARAPPSIDPGKVLTPPWSAPRSVPAGTRRRRGLQAGQGPDCVFFNVPSVFIVNQGHMCESEV